MSAPATDSVAVAPLAALRSRWEITLALFGALAAAATVALPSEAHAQYGHHYGYGYGHGYYGHGYGGHGPYGYGAYGSNDGHVRIEVAPKGLRDEAHVYVNEAHVGVVDDFDGFFQRLVLNPGKYEIEVRLDGYHPLQVQILVTHRSTYKIRDRLEPIVAN